MSETAWPTKACKGCGEPMIWTRTAAKGKAMPVDAEPSPEGTFQLSESSDGECIADFVPKPSRGGRDLYMPHWKTCPNAGDFRKEKG